MKATLVLIALTLAATTTWAQDAAKPLNLRLPADYVPAPSSTAPAPPPAQAPEPKGPTVAPKNGGENIAVNPTRPSDPPGTYYGDTTGRMDGVVEDDTPRCDDATYNKPQVHGSVSTGFVSGSGRGNSGNYPAGAVNVSQAFGSCDHPTGGVSISIGAGQSNFGRGRIH
jgi:hypothetical protein